MKASLRLLLCAGLLLAPSSLRADGGRLILSERAGRYQVSVFTSPTPLRAGPVDISVFVQDAGTGEHLPQASVVVRLRPRGGGEVLSRPATAEAATNKLFRAAEFTLPSPGRWDAEIQVDGPRGTAVVRCELEAAEALPRGWDLWAWIGWPALAILLFTVHQRLVWRRSRFSDQAASVLRPRRAAGDHL